MLLPTNLSDFLINCSLEVNPQRMKITDINQLDLNKRYSYADYLTWQFDEMVELIKGKVFKMSPAPSAFHQEVSGNLYGAIWVYLKNKSCKAYSAPFDVILPLPDKQQSDDNIDTVVQPDICVLCDEAKIVKGRCKGAPDWIIEILSKSTANKDLTHKFELYQNARVLEYWVVHPYEGTIIPYQLDDNGQYQLLRKTPFVSGEKVPVGIFPDFEIPVLEVFGE